LGGLRLLPIEVTVEHGDEALTTIIGPWPQIVEVFRQDTFVLTQLVQVLPAATKRIGADRRVGREPRVVL
jgi:hypothetical protein